MIWFVDRLCNLLKKSPSARAISSNSSPEALQVAPQRSPPNGFAARLQLFRMGDLKTRLANARAKLLRKNSNHTTTSDRRSIASSAGSDRRRVQAVEAGGEGGVGGLKSLSLTKLPEISSARVSNDDYDRRQQQQHQKQQGEQRMSQSAVLPQRKGFHTDGGDSDGVLEVEGTRAADNKTDWTGSQTDRQHHRPNTNTTDTITAPATTISPSTTIPSAESSSSLPANNNNNNNAAAASVHTVPPEITLEEPTPIPLGGRVKPSELVQLVPQDSASASASSANSSAVTVPVVPDQPSPSTVDSEHPSELPQSSSARSSSRPTPPAVIRRQSLVNTSNARIIKTLLDTEAPPAAIASGPPTSDYFGVAGAAATFNASMLHRKIWVKRANASATLVQVREDDLVDDVRDMILKKYGNSLGRSFDAPDVTLRIHPRDTNNKSGDRLLGPEEDICRTLDAYFPGGQTVHEALIIEVPQRRTPKPSPRIPLYYSHHDDTRPLENSSEYFPPMLPVAHPSPAAMTAISHDSRITLPHAHSISVLQTGQLPPLPSPGSRRTHHVSNRPRNPRHNTASPTTLTGGPSIPISIRPAANRPRHDSSASDTKHSASSSAPIPTPPAPAESIPRQNSTPPTPRVASPRPDKAKRKKQKAIDLPSLPSGLLDGSVPPINVLIVEDNIINLRVLGAFMQRLKVRWQRAMNGKEAVTKWRAGGFHLVLMDIQLPIMNGLEATKEIRRLERVNSIGVFSSGSNEAPNNKLADAGYEKELNEDDKLGDKSLFKSPVIIVALTASSLQSDRHEALAAGCNDFLTKPVNFVWLERKVKEWGCMQALIDFDGWRKWKDFANPSEDSTSKLSTSFQGSAPRTKNSTNLSPITANGVASTKTKEEDRKNKRKSLGVVPQPPLPEEDSETPTPPES